MAVAGKTIIDGDPNDFVFTRPPGSSGAIPSRPRPPGIAVVSQQPSLIVQSQTPSVAVIPGQPGYSPAYAGAQGQVQGQGYPGGQFPAPSKQGRSFVNLSYKGGSYNFGGNKLGIGGKGTKDSRGRSPTRDKKSKKSKTPSSSPSPSPSGSQEEKKKKKRSSMSPSRLFGRKKKSSQSPSPSSSPSSQKKEKKEKKQKTPKPPGSPSGKKKRSSLSPSRIFGKKNKNKAQKATAAAASSAKKEKKQKTPKPASSSSGKKSKKSGGGSKYGLNRLFNQSQINDHMGAGHPYDWRSFRRGHRRRFRRGHRRHHPMLHESLLGTQNSHSANSKHVFSKLGKHYREQRKIDNNARAFISAMRTVKNKYGGIGTSIESFALHRKIMSAFRKNKGFSIELTHGGVTDTLPGSVWPMPNDSQIEGVFVPDAQKPSIVLTNGETITIAIEHYSYSATFVNLAHDAKVSKIPINLYDEANYSIYAKNRTPTLYALLTVTPSDAGSSGGAPSFRLQTLSLILDMNPPKIPRSHLGFAGHPDVQATMAFTEPSATTSHKHESNVHVKALHEEIAGLLGPKVVFVSKHDQSVPDPDATVIWGELTGTAVAYASIKAIGEQVRNLDDPEFLPRIFNIYPDLGPKVLAKIQTLMGTISHVDDEGKARQTFPTLRQLLSHTSGLPAGTHLSCEDVYAMYQEATDILNGTLPKTSPSSSPAGGASPPLSAKDISKAASTAAAASQDKPFDSYEVQEAAFLQSLDMLDTMDNPPNSSFGNWFNTTEGVLVAMFLRRFVYPKRYPEETVSRTFSNMNSSIDISWAKDDENVPFSPYALVECAQSKRSGIVAYARQLSEEFHSSNLNASPLAIMLANPIMVPGTDFITHIAWKALAEPGHFIYFCGNDTPGLQSTLVFFIPSLDFWGVAISDALTNAPADIVSHRDILGSVADALTKLELPSLPGTAVARIPGSLENSKYVKSVADLQKVPGNFPFDITYISAVTDITNSYLPVLKLKPLERAPNMAVVTISSPQGDELTSFDIAFDAESGKYVVVRENGDLGEEVVITKDIVSIASMGAYLNSVIFGPVVGRLTAAVEHNTQKAAEDVFGYKSVGAKVTKASNASTLLRSASNKIVSAAPPSIGVNVAGALLAGAAAGVVGGVTLAGINRAYPGYYYGRRYYGPRYYAPPPVVYAPGYVIADAIGWDVNYPVPCDPILDPYCLASGYYPIGYVPPLYWPRARWYGIPYGRRGGPRWSIGGGWRGNRYRNSPRPSGRGYSTPRRGGSRGGGGRRR